MSLTRTVNLKIAPGLRPFQMIALKIILPLLLVSGVVAYFATASVRQEQALRRSSLSQLQDAARREPDNPRVLYYLGRRLDQDGQRAAAAAALEHAASLSDTEEVYLAWAATVPDSQANLILTAFLARHPGSAQAHLALARLFQQRSDVTHCYEQMFLAIKAGAATAAAWQLYGDSAFHLGNVVEAEKAYRRALALEPDSVRDYVALGAVLMQLNRTTEGITALQQAVALAPKDGTVWVALGSAVLADAETPAALETARQYLLKGLRLRPDLAAAHLYLGECLLKERRWREAAAELNQAAALLPEDSAIPFAQAKAYRGLGDGPRAARALLRHQSLTTFRSERMSLLLRVGGADDAATHLAIARLAARYGVLHTAVTEYQAALALAPEDAQIARELLAARRAAGGQRRQSLGAKNPRE